MIFPSKFFSFGVYCESKNNKKECQDYKYRLCCPKPPPKKYYGDWSEWSGCEGNCGANNGKKKRKQKCFEKRANCEETENGLFHFQTLSCTIPCEGKIRLSG